MSLIFYICVPQRPLKFGLNFYFPQLTISNKKYMIRLSTSYINHIRTITIFKVGVL